MMYSVVPDGVIFPDKSDRGGRSEILTHNGQLIEVRELDGRQTVSRLISTEPSSYLQSCFQPGADFTRANR